MSSHQVKEINCTQGNRIEKQDDQRVLKPHLEWNSTETKKEDGEQCKWTARTELK